MKLTNDFFKVESSEPAENGMRYAITLNPHHAIYRAHFPGNPITPGVCIIQIAGELLEKYCGKTLMLKKLNNVKFLSTLVPGTTSALEVILSDVAYSAGTVKAKAIVKDADKVYSKISATYSHE